MEYPIFRGNLIILSNGDKNMDQIKTGNFLVSLRKEKNITQQQLADILQVSVKAVSKWECGEGYPSIQSLKDLSDFYGVTVDEIINGERNKTEAKEPVNTSIQIKEKKPLNFPILRSISLGITGLGIMLYFIIMYCCYSTAGSLICILFTTLIGLVLSLIELKHYKDRKNNIIALFNYEFIIIGIALSFISFCFSLATLTVTVENYYVTVDSFHFATNFVNIAICLIGFLVLLIWGGIEYGLYLKKGKDFFDALKDKGNRILAVNNVSLIIVLILYVMLDSNKYNCIWYQVVFFAIPSLFEIVEAFINKYEIIFKSINLVLCIAAFITSITMINVFSNYVVELITILFIETAALSFALSFVISSLKKKEVKSIENK
ncbi:dNA-binding helix-turn-helix protein [Clostridium sp. CAG:568]|nr:dNA-binding helix-turn-helix protein [Clostridium sp. CAG:568]